jgi:hypothetical protein
MVMVGGRPRVFFTRYDPKRRMMRLNGGWEQRGLGFRGEQIRNGDGSPDSST